MYFFFLHSHSASKWTSPAPVFPVPWLRISILLTPNLSGPPLPLCVPTGQFMFKAILSSHVSQAFSLPEWQWQFQSRLPTWNILAHLCPSWPTMASAHSENCSLKTVWLWNLGPSSIISFPSLGIVPSEYNPPSASTRALFQCSSVTTKHNWCSGPSYEMA